ncbi:MULTISPECIES: ABC transporter substrate-binding protein [Rhizobium/Agrobacterium group]|uniref:Peptide/nickel transport system substrate-binding protein n=1 Tax=Agrobacterium tumefaciens TaxID=358 RepID=A0A2L2LLM7_AGRTU|nr:MULTISPECIES: ABC transporter substrate-binding protein [Rhizobium/Agrobacterium group]AVH45230.1 peptide/nickel transport system substrate-binding protein [Agrobacterium tumefaciens]NSY99447.1 ABC transporter substrate-binding protein [Agrobacterium tumefaciens]NSZ66716.1 ABC transporter substrate-binding protein [Agrobacterium tumefaciens]NTA19596.1 ABC transporter substrate-binding protein [Agrobacterium tumefaciens]NTA73165.1 ABC transporter substrate-binding protein [Agrobacterium tume
MTRHPKPDSSLELDRRLFLKASAAVAASALLLPAMANAATPKRGGHLVLGIDNASTSDRLDPAFYFEDYAYNVGLQLFDTLTDLNDDGTLRAGLAESWEPANGGSEWIFRLRKGVQFHNGKELTPEDVIYSINHHRGDKSESAGKGYLLTVTDIVKSAPGEVTFKLSGPNADFPYLLGDVHFGITPDGENFDKGIGTGAFILEDFQPGVRTLAKRNPSYWDPERGHVDSVETVAYNDKSARVAALLSKSVHLVNNVESRVAQRLSNRQGVTLHTEADSSIILFVGRADADPFKNHDVQLALKYAIDRGQIVNSILNDAGTVSNDNPIFPSNRYFTNDVPKHGYDPEKASYHWKKAGYGGKIVLSAADGATFSGALDAAQLYQQSAEKVGIPFEVNRVPADGYWNDVWLKHPFVASGWAARPTADAMLSLIYLSNAPWNESGWKNKAFDELVLAARGELDETRRKTLYHDAQVLIVEQNSSVIPAYAAKISASVSNLQGFKSIPGQVGPRTAEKVWFDT